MAIRKRASSATETDAPPLTNTIRESAQQIWLAGLGAFAKAQAEGGKVFEALVREGQTMQRKTQTAAEEGLQEASSRMSSLASDVGTRAAGQWGRLETLFEDRVATALGKLGMPTAHELATLRARIDELSAQVQALGAAPVSRRSPSRKPVAAKAAARSAARKSARKSVRQPAARKTGQNTGL